MRPVLRLFIDYITACGLTSACGSDAKNASNLDASATLDSADLFTSLFGAMSTSERTEMFSSLGSVSTTALESSTQAHLLAALFLVQATTTPRLGLVGSASSLTSLQGITNTLAAYAVPLSMGTVVNGKGAPANLYIPGISGSQVNH